jgi:hypothetical protein
MISRLPAPGALHRQPHAAIHKRQVGGGLCTVLRLKSVSGISMAIRAIFGPIPGETSATDQRRRGCIDSISMVATPIVVYI